MDDVELTLKIANNPNFVAKKKPNFYISDFTYAHYAKNGTRLEVGICGDEYRMYVTGYDSNGKSRSPRQRDYTELIKQLDCALDVLDFFFVCMFKIPDPNLMEDVKRIQNQIISWIKNNKPRLYSNRESNPQRKLRDALNKMRGGP